MLKKKILGISCFVLTLLGLVQAQIVGNPMFDAIDAQTLDVMNQLQNQQQYLGQQLTQGREQLIQWYIAEYGYERAYQEYQLGLQQAQQMGWMQVPFEDFVYYQALAVQGVDLNAMSQQWQADDARIAASRQELYAMQDTAHQSWRENNIYSNSYADFNIGAIRGEWDYQNPYTGEIYRLPSYPDANTLYRDPYGGSFYYDLQGWFQIPIDGYATPLYSLPSTLGF